MDHRKMENVNEEFSSFVSTNNHPNLLDLPCLVLHCLFEFLDFDDIFELKKVCKKFYFFIRKYEIKEISFVDYGYYPFDYKTIWFTTAKPIKLRNQVGLKKLGLITNPPDTLLNVRFLRVKGRNGIEGSFPLNPMSFDFKYFKQFIKLQVLVLYSLKATTNNNLLELPYLKALSIRLCLNDCDKLIIDAPNLNSLHMSFTDYEKIEFKHPLSIKFLRCYYFKRKIMEFKNLEHLELGKYKNFEIEDLFAFKNLKSIMANGYNNVKTVGKLKSLYASKKKNVDMFLDGIKVKDISKFNEFEKMGRFKFQIKNYAELEGDLHYCKLICYESILNISPNNQIPSYIYNKFINIQEIIVYEKPENENDFLDLIKGCQNLFHMSLYAVFSQGFYDRLTAISFLTRLSLRCKNIDFKFINKMTYLTYLEAFGSYILENGDVNLNDFKYLREVRIIYHTKILKLGRDNYTIHKSTIPIHKNLSFNELIKWINESFEDDP